jgi:hypothetical protein
MRAMKHANLAEEDDGDAATFALRDLSPEPSEERLNILPGDVRAGWVGVEGLKGALVAALHGAMVPQVGTKDERCSAYLGGLSVEVQHRGV